MYNGLPRCLKPLNPTNNLFHHERKYFLSRAQTFFLVSTSLFYRERKGHNREVIRAKQGGVGPKADDRGDARPLPRSRNKGEGCN